MPVSTSVTVDTNQRGVAIPKESRELVERLQGQAFELQNRFDSAERTAMLLAEMLNGDSDLHESLDNTYEAFAFNTMRLQLFRALVTDICACILDTHNKSGSVRRILAELRGDDTLDAIKAYYADTSCVNVTISSTDEGLPADYVERRRVEELRTFADEQIQWYEAEWPKIDKDAAILEDVAAKRLLWARTKVIAHFDKSKSGLVGFSDNPDAGEGPLLWSEPLDFIECVRPFVYSVFHFVTANSWDESFRDLNRFYARAFWDRFTSGSTDLEPE